ncbi:MAG: methylenetetrahydrofolate reductase [Deltaproteobacteria bacterium]|nr:methylenetetrahydrofolate reductase [Deltaproteobacteria bacterium]
MTVTDLLRAKKPDNLTISVEITPPTRGNSIETMFRIMDDILPFSPLWIDVTSHASGVEWIPTQTNHYKKRIFRKSPGTIAICAALEHKFNIPMVPHLLCHGFSCEETEDALIDLGFLGIQNIMALRGDGSPKEKRADKTYHNHAVDLIDQIQHINQGKYLSTEGQPTDFEIGVACYPEKHFEAPNLEWDVEYFVAKQNRGADYAVTQMFFDNSPFFNFEQLIADQVHIPIIPATKIVSSSKQLVKLSKFFHVDFPSQLVNQMMDAKTPLEASEVGLDWTYQQCLNLIENNHRHLHFYLMKNTDLFCSLMRRLF